VHLVHGSNHALYLKQYHYLSRLNLVLNVYLSPIHKKIKIEQYTLREHLNVMHKLIIMVGQLEVVIFFSKFFWHP
jgi:hypothetical protein